MATESFSLTSDADIVPPKSFDLLSDADIVPPKSFDLLSDALVLPPTAFALTSDALVTEPTSPPATKQLALTSDAMIAEAQPVFRDSRFACPDKIACECPELPLENLSSEDADEPVFCSTVTVYGDPPLGVCAEELQCTRFCCSDESQLEAYLCALREANECMFGSWSNGTCPPGDPPGGDTPGCPPICPPNPCPPCSPFCPSHCDGPPVTLFYNTQQTCTINCPEGGTFFWTVAAGTIVSTSQVTADYLAYQMACRLAKQRKICFTIDLLDDGCVDDDYTTQITARGGRPFVSPFVFEGTVFIPVECPDLPQGTVVPYHYEITSGSLPPGLELQCYGYIKGKPTLAGDYPFTIQINDANGITATKDYTIHIDDCGDTDYGNIEPSILSGNITYWNSEADIPAGMYRISYVMGAMGYGQPGLWYVNADANGPAAYYINNGSTQIQFPTNTSIPDVVIDGVHYGHALFSQGAIEAAYAGYAISFYHSGGKIGMHLRDTPYGDNIAGSPNPTFNLKKV